jgi:hypothetical protein
VILFLTTSLLSACGSWTAQTAHPIQTVQDNGWKIGAKIHFEEESGRGYQGLKEINKIVKDNLKEILAIAKDSCEENAKILLVKNQGAIEINSYTEKINPTVGEEMHATLLYTKSRGHGPETLRQVCEALLVDCRTSPKIEEVAKVYGAIIKPSWRFKISEIFIMKGDKGLPCVVAKLLWNEQERILLRKKPISAWLYMTLASCAEDSILSDPIVIDRLTQKLNTHLKGQFLKIAFRNGVADLEFGLSGQHWRIRSGQKTEFQP